MESEVPHEPFAYFSSPSWLVFRIREPIALIAAGAAFLAVFVGFGAFALADPRHPTGAAAFAALAFAVGVGIGGFAVVAGSMRLRWKRNFERTMGRSPW